MTLGRSAKALNHTVMNLASSLIQHEHITTTPAKAELAAKYVENLINKTKKYQSQDSPAAIKEWTHLLHGQIYNPEITIPKLLNVSSQRYGSRSRGFTRELKLENRFGDNAPQVILELVGNGDREMKLWITAKTIARLQLQNLQIDELSQKNWNDSININGEDKFNEVLEICKKELFKDDNLNLKPRMKSNTNGFNKQFTNFEFVKRE